MANIIDFNPEFLVVNDFNIECIFRKTDIFSYLIFSESNKNKKMLDDYVKVIDAKK